MFSSHNNLFLHIIGYNNIKWRSHNTYDNTKAYFSIDWWNLYSTPSRQ